MSEGSKSTNPQWESTHSQKLPYGKIQKYYKRKMHKIFHTWILQFPVSLEKWKLMNFVVNKVHNRDMATNFLLPILWCGCEEIVISGEWSCVPHRNLVSWKGDITDLLLKLKAGENGGEDTGGTATIKRTHLMAIGLLEITAKNEMLEASQSQLGLQSVSELNVLWLSVRGLFSFRFSWHFFL